MFQPGNQIGMATRWKPGDITNPGGRPPRMTTSLREWWNALCAEDVHGTAKYSVTDLEKIASTKKSDKSVSITKRLAARQILKTLGPKGDARKMAELFFDRLEGKPRQEIDINATLHESKVIMLCGPSFLQEQGDESVPARPDDLSYLTTLPDGQQVWRPISELPDGDQLKARMEKGGDQHSRNLEYLSSVGLENNSSTKMPELPFPLGGIEAIMAVPDPIETRRPPIQLDLIPGVVEGPVEINPATGLPRHPLDVA